MDINTLSYGANFVLTVILIGVWTYKGTRPAADICKKVAEHDDFLKKDRKTLKEIESNEQIILNALLSLLNHIIEGNNIDSMKETRKSLQKELKL